MHPSLPNDHTSIETNSAVNSVVAARCMYTGIPSIGKIRTQENIVQSVATTTISTTKDGVPS